MTTTERSKNNFILIVVSLFCLAVGNVLSPLLADDNKTSPSSTPLVAIKVEGTSAIAIKDAYNALVAADRQLQFAILQAKYDLTIPKGFEFNIATFSFEPPKPKEEVKESVKESLKSK